MPSLRVALMIAGLCSLASVAWAQDEQRYQLQQTDGGYVRMDTRTGEMSVCKEQASQLVCRLAADERAAFQDEVDRLSGALKALEDRVVALEKMPALPGLPTEEQFDRTLGYMERFFRGFMDIVKDYEKDRQPSATPQKT